MRHAARILLVALRPEGYFSGFFEEDFVREFFERGHIACHAPEVHTPVFKHAATVSKPASNGLDANAGHSFLDPVEELNLLERRAGLPVLVAQGIGAAVTAREDPVLVSPHHCVNGPTCYLHYLLLHAQQVLVCRGVH